MRTRLAVASLGAVVLIALLAGIVYNLPPIHERLAWRFESLRTKVQYAIHPPQQAIFVPQQQDAPLVQATLTAIPPTETLTATPIPTLTPTPPGPTSTPLPTETPTPTFTPIPQKVSLKGVVHEYQKFNNCGPANLSMALSYWDWHGNQLDTRAYLRPNQEVDDKNVMPAEMVAYVETQTQFKVLTRIGGDQELIKRLIAAGFPVIIESGFELPKEDWMGHFELITGYDDNRQKFTTQDSYIMADFPLPYTNMLARWRDFNYVYLVVYPAEKEDRVLSILGPQADLTYNYQHAAQTARDEITTSTGRDLFFAWYNLGSSLTALQDYAGAAEAYDRAFVLYPRLSDKERPWRMLWYQVGPYPAYYYTGRYQDVINLANTTLFMLINPSLEESFYWRGMARIALGNQESGIDDLKKAAWLNPNFNLPQVELQSLGIQSP
jgi:hypothetical protein